MIKFTVFFKDNTDFLDIRRFHLAIKLSGCRPGDDFKGIGFEKSLCRPKISCVTHGFPIPTLPHQGIAPQGHGRMPDKAVFGDTFFGMGNKK
jgi:hypothetical protein